MYVMRRFQRLKAWNDRARESFVVYNIDLELKEHRRKKKKKDIGFAYGYRLYVPMRFAARHLIVSHQSAYITASY